MCNFWNLVSPRSYFFYATDARQATDDYNLEDDEEDEAQESHVPMEATVDIDEAQGPTEEEKQVFPKVEEMDPELAEWLKIDEKPATIDVNDDSVTEADSDNVERDEVEEDLDDWFQVKERDASTSSEHAGDKKFEEKVIWILHSWVHANDVL